MQQNFCQYQKKMQGRFGKYKKYCGKPAVAVDSNGRRLCQKCLNKYNLKLSKNEKKK